MSQRNARLASHRQIWTILVMVLSSPDAAAIDTISSFRSAVAACLAMTVTYGFNLSAHVWRHGAGTALVHSNDMPTGQVPNPFDVTVQPT